jgi:hypothetical protein
MQQSTSATLVFAQPHSAYEKFNLNKPKPVIIHEPYKVAMLKHVKYQPVPQDDLEMLINCIIIIGITSKQWGARADFGWCTTYHRDVIHNTLGNRASTAMTTSSYNNCTQADLQTLQAALLFLQMHLKHVWHHQMQFQVITEHKALLTALCHLWKTDTHNPQQRLNWNWKILQSINHNNDIHNMKCQLAQDNNPTHHVAINTPNTCMLEYQATHLTLVARQQPTLEYGLVYLPHGNTIINKRYDEAIAQSYNWPKFPLHCHNKFQWSEKTFKSVHWDAFQHQGKNSA